MVLANMFSERLECRPRVEVDDDDIESMLALGLKGILKDILAVPLVSVTNEETAACTRCEGSHAGLRVKSTHEGSPEVVYIVTTRFE